ncbi:S8 family serine peptidase [Brevibacillus dissolubilis]|uniref:S8 family serine peptidase n=1 Tax=Brevibacillus dissolubilis TaxID=1844116 RepID=UPI00159BC980|nr:S8 family serine peptidase [Brevibacillus dissolubilis]
MKHRVLTVLVMFGMVMQWFFYPATTIAEGPAEGAEGKVIIGLKKDVDPEKFIQKKSWQNKKHKKNKHIKALHVEVTDREFQQLRFDPDVAYVEADATTEISDEPAQSGSQASLHTQAKPQPQTNDQATPWGIRAIGADLAQSHKETDKKVKIAVFDTGIAPHTDLSVTEAVYFGEKIRTTTDDNGHGTHVAGTIAALNNNSGVVGAAPEAELYSVKVLDQNGSGSYSQVIEAIDWAIDQKIDIISMSFGGNTYSQALHEAVQVADNHGILLIAAAGNGGQGEETETYPARYPEVLSVGAINQSYKRAYFSSTGEELDLVAPGSTVLSTTMDGGTGTKSGTSMAAPHVAGVAALIWGADKKLTNDDVKKRLIESATPLGDQREYGHGLVNAAKALGITDGPIGPLPAEEPTTEPPILTPDQQISLIHDYDVKVTGAIQTMEWYVKLAESNGKTALAEEIQQQLQQVREQHLRLIDLPDEYERVPVSDSEAAALQVGIDSYFETKKAELNQLRQTAEQWRNKYHDSLFPVNTDESDTEETQATADAYEPNDDFSIATKISTWGTSISGTIPDEKDLDVFQLTASKSGSTSVSLKVPAGATFVYAVHDANHNVIDGYTDVTSSSEKTISFYVTAGSTYYIGISIMQNPGSTNPYTLTINQISDPILFASSPVDVQGAKGETVLFRFTPPQSGIYKVFTSPYKALGVSNNTKLALYDSYTLSKLLTENDNASSTTVFSEIQYSLTANVTYFIKLSPAVSTDALHTRITAQYVGASTPTPTAPKLTAIRATVNEAAANDGSITDVQVVALENSTFVQTDLRAGIRVNNLPAGLTINVTRNSDTQFTISFSGKATQHTKANSITNASVTVDPALITGTTSSITSNTFGFTFIDAATVGEYLYTYKYDDNNRLLSVSKIENGLEIPRWEYVYDLNGNLAERKVVSGDTPPPDTEDPPTTPPPTTPPPTSPPPTTDPNYVAITASPSMMSLKQGQSQQINVTVLMLDGTSTSANAVAVYEAQNSAVATVNQKGTPSPGMVHAVGKGNTSVTVSFNGLTSIVNVAVTTAIKNYSVTPGFNEVRIGEPTTVSLYANYEDGSVAKLSGVTFAALNPDIATIDSSGKLTGLKEGKAQFTTTFQGQTMVWNTLVVQERATALQITPNPIEVSPGERTVRIRAQYPDGSMKDVTEVATLSSSNEGIFAPNPANPGYLQVAKVGAASLKVGFGGLSQIVPVHVANIYPEQYQASMDFSNLQGKNDWYYQEWTGSAYKDLNYTGSGNYWNGSYPYTSVFPNRQETDAYDSVRKWVAPRQGTVQISGNVAQQYADCGDGFQVRIMKNNTQIWPNTGWQYVAADDTVGFSHDISVEVNTGDAIYFVMNQGAQNNWCDRAEWDPTITYSYSKSSYTASQDFSNIQGQNNWYYQEWTGSAYQQLRYVDSGNFWNGSYTYTSIFPNRQETDAYDSVRSWVAPRQGTVRVSGNVAQQFADCGDGFQVRIMKNNTQIWPNTGWQHIAFDDIIGLSHDIQIQVNAGDTIHFVMNQGAQNNWCDRAVWDPTISYDYLKTSYTASGDFGPVQGLNNWYYQEYKWDTLYQPMSFNGSYWKGSFPNTDITAGVQHPDESDSVRKWVAPMTGLVRISGRAFMDDHVCGDGVWIKIVKNATKIWPYEEWAVIRADDQVGASHDIEIDVVAGEEIYFIVNKGMTDNYCDGLNWDPTISY